MADAKKQADKPAHKADADPVVEELGLRGLEVDPTPNENYTVAGVLAGAPTPETDEASAETARKARVEVDKAAAGVAGK